MGGALIVVAKEFSLDGAALGLVELTVECGRKLAKEDLREQNCAIESVHHCHISS